MNAKGKLITFEGPDGSGKTTQIHRLAEVLQKNNLPFLLTREPGGTVISDRIREMLLNPGNRAMADATEILLYAASRSQHVREKILPALREGKNVLCDRFTDASIAYQGYGLGQDVAEIQHINRFATGGLEPDRTYLIDVSPETGRRRMRARQGLPETGATHQASELDRIEARALAYHQRVREGFHALYRENRRRIVFVNGESDSDTIFTAILRDASNFLHLKTSR